VNHQGHEKLEGHEVHKGMAFIETTRVGAVEYLTLNRPDVRNAFNEQMIAELTSWAAGIERSPDDLRAVVLSGAGKTFSAGADVAWMSKTVDYSERENIRDATAASQMFSALDHLPVPLIGRVHGAALGGGAGLVAVCDIVISADTAVFGFTEVKLGILPAVISPFVLAKVGRSAARELFLTGARFGASRAREIGLVHAVAPESDLDSTVSAYVSNVLAGGPQAIRSAKALIRDVWGLSPGQASSVTAEAIAKRRVSDEGQEGLRAFLEKRTPSWIRRQGSGVRDQE
jgi:methylglutaconyl-CoA hydratase